MNSRINHGISAVDKLPLSGGRILDSQGGLEERMISPVPERDFPSTWLEEEESFRNNLLHAGRTAGYVESRNFTWDALMLMALYVQNKVGNVFSREGGLDIGSGSTGEMINLLPPFVNKDSWILSDINRHSVDSLKKLFPGNMVLQASYLNLNHFGGMKGSIPCVTGISSLDSTYFIDRAISEIRDVLQEGGAFYHVQDAVPERRLLFNELVMRGIHPPFKVKAKKDTGEALLYEVDGQMVDTVDLFRAHIVRAIKSTPGMELVFDKYVCVETTETDKKGIFVPGVSYISDCLRRVGHTIDRHVAAHVLVARKKAA